jgi:hypothetical protein
MMRSKKERKMKTTQKNVRDESQVEEEEASWETRD